MAALFTLPHFPSLSCSPNTLRTSSTWHRFPWTIKAQMTAGESEIQSEKRGVAVLWFKHDLRIDDHPGLLAASDHSSLVPLYVFDHRIVSRFSDETLEMLIIALEDLRNSLISQGSNLMVRLGNAGNVIRNLAKQVNATHLYAEEEVEYELRKLIGSVKENLALEMLPFAEGNPNFVLWQTPFYDLKNLKDLPDSYDDFTKLQLPVSSPLPASALPGANEELNWGPIPTFDDLMEFMNKNPRKPKMSWTSIKGKSTETILMNELLKSGENNQKKSSLKYGQRFQGKRADNSVFVTRKGSVVGGGTNTVLNALAAYLRYLEGTARGDWQEVHERVCDAEAREGASFFKLFGPALTLGIVSRRRMHFEAIKYEKERNAGFLSPFGYSAVSVTAAVDGVCSMEWYWLMSLKNQMSDEKNYLVRIWRWKGYLIQYIVAGHEGPATLLVHGFGAFLEHYRDNIHDIAKGGNRVWAITLLGFGKSEKPNIVYTELMWAEFLRDFIIEVVGEPVHIVGNSVGGYFSAILSCLWPALAKSVVLINSAGNVIPGYSLVPFTKERRTSGAAWLGARLLLFYLRSRLSDIVKNCYPTKTERVDDNLVSEMLRASHDPGVVVVLESIFSFNLSLPLNYLLKDFKDKVLVIQGMKDPLSNSKSKLAMLKEHCDGIVIKTLDAGHCPHDEVPEEVNSLIRRWIVALESKIPVGSSI